MDKKVPSIIGDVKCLNPCACEYKRDKDGLCMDFGWCTFQADDKKADGRHKKQGAKE